MMFFHVLPDDSIVTCQKENSSSNNNNNYILTKYSMDGQTQFKVQLAAGQPQGMIQVHLINDSFTIYDRYVTSSSRYFLAQFLDVLMLSKITERYRD